MCLCYLKRWKKLSLVNEATNCEFTTSKQDVYPARGDISCLKCTKVTSLTLFEYFYGCAILISLHLNAGGTDDCHMYYTIAHLCGCHGD